MSNGFIHSIKVPRLYKTTSKIVKQVVEDGASLKPLIYQKKHPNVQAILALASTILQRGAELNQVLRKTGILFKESRLDPWLARVLITELFWGKKSLNGDAKPIQTILQYESELREALNNVDRLSTNLSAQKKANKPRYIRINTIITSTREAIAGFQSEGYGLLPPSCNYQSFLASLGTLSQWTFIQDFHIPELFAFAPGTQFHNHPGYQAGAIILQDKASCLPAYLLNPAPGSVVLDMCAAPGMKTTHLASIIRDKGKIYSVEMNERRYQLLCEFVDTAKADSITTINADAMTLDPSQCPAVEYILVDPSCSGSGMDRPDFDGVRGKCAPLRLKKLQSFQVMLLRHALLKFPSAKRVVYSTCSIHPEENEMVVDEVLEDIGEAYKLVPVKTLLRNDWLHFSSREYNCKDNCLYARPDVDYSNGFFVAVFERNFDAPLPEYKRSKYIKKENSNAIAIGTDDNRTEKDLKWEGTFDNSIDNNAEQSGKKKKKKTKAFEPPEEQIETVEANENGSEEPPKKKKKKKEKTEANENENDEPSLNKKKTKKSVSIEQPLEGEVETSTVNDELPKKKKKSKSHKRKSEEEKKTSEINDNPDIHDEPPKEKKKKLKSHKNLSDQEVNISEININIEIQEIPLEKKKIVEITLDSP